MKSREEYGTPYTVGEVRGVVKEGYGPRFMELAEDHLRFLLDNHDAMCEHFGIDRNKNFCDFPAQRGIPYSIGEVRGVLQKAEGYVFIELAVDHLRFMLDEHDVMCKHFGIEKDKDFRETQHEMK